MIVLESSLRSRMVDPWFLSSLAGESKQISVRVKKLIGLTSSKSSALDFKFLRPPEYENTKRAGRLCRPVHLFFRLLANAGTTHPCVRGQIARRTCKQCVMTNYFTVRFAWLRMCVRPRKAAQKRKRSSALDLFFFTIIAT